MIVSLVGMSGAGKTHWSKKLEKEGFKRYSIDDLIEISLKNELKKLEYQGIGGVAKWMGQPFDKQYFKAEITYLSHEKQAMEKVLSIIEEEERSHSNIVIDSTGSVIYMEKELLQKLAKKAIITYIKIPREAEKQLYEIYKKDPKPVIWGNMYMRKKGEDNWRALSRCYKNLLRFRASCYQKLAHLTLDYSLLKDPLFSTTRLISKIRIQERELQYAPAQAQLPEVEENDTV